MHFCTFPIEMTQMCHILTFPDPPCQPGQIFLVQNGSWNLIVDTFFCTKIKKFTIVNFFSLDACSGPMCPMSMTLMLVQNHSYAERLECHVDTTGGALFQAKLSARGQSPRIRQLVCVTCRPLFSLIGGPFLSVVSSEISGPEIYFLSNTPSPY